MSEANSTLTVRALSCNITPPWPSILGANGLPEQQISEAADPLEANVVVLGNFPGAIVLVSMDLLYVGAKLESLIRSRVEHLVAPDRLFLAASHTHRAPMVDATKRGLGTPSPQVVQWIAEAVSSTVLEAAEQPGVQCRVEVSYGTHNAGVHRRRKRLFSLTRTGIRFNATFLAPNPSGPNDNAIRRLRFVNAVTGCAVAHAWSTALHPTAYPRRDVMSADFPGAVRRAIRADAGSDVPVLFLQGFSGDIRPSTPQRPLGLRRLLKGPGFAGFTQAQFERWLQDLSNHVLTAAWEPLRGNTLASMRLKAPRRTFVFCASPPSEGFLHGVRIGSLLILGVPSEVVVQYTSSLAAVSPLEHVWGVGCIDHVWGYAPTARMLREGGYEAEGFCKAFGVERVNPHVETELRGRIESMVRALADV